MNKNLRWLGLVGLLLSFMLCSCINNYDTEITDDEVVLPKVDSGEVSNDIDSDGELEFTELDFVSLIVDVFREYHEFLNEIKTIENAASDRRIIDFSDENVSENDFSGEVKEFFNKYEDCLEFFLSFLRLTDCRKNIDFDYEIGLANFNYSKLMEIYSELKNLYDGDLYFPEFGEIFGRYDELTGIFDENSNFRNFVLQLKILYDMDLESFYAGGMFGVDFIVPDLNRLIEDFYTCQGFSVESIDLPIKELQVKIDSNFNVTSDYAVTKEVVKDISLDGTLSYMEKFGFLLDVFAESDFTLTGAVNLGIKTKDSADYFMMVKPEINFENDGLEEFFGVLLDEKKSLTDKILALREQNVSMGFTLFKENELVFSNKYSLEKLIDLYWLCGE